MVCRSAAARAFDMVWDCRFAAAQPPIWPAVVDLPQPEPSIWSGVVELPYARAHPRGIRAKPEPRTPRGLTPSKAPGTRCRKGYLT